MVTIVENGLGDMSSNAGQDCSHFTLGEYSEEKHESNYFPSNYG